MSWKYCGDTVCVRSYMDVQRSAKCALNIIHTLTIQRRTCVLHSQLRAHGMFGWKGRSVLMYHSSRRRQNVKDAVNTTKCSVLCSVQTADVGWHMHVFTWLFSVCYFFFLLVVVILFRNCSRISTSNYRSAFFCSPCASQMRMEEGNFGRLHLPTNTRIFARMHLKCMLLSALSLMSSADGRACIFMAKCMWKCTQSAILGHAYI